MLKKLLIFCLCLTIFIGIGSLTYARDKMSWNTIEEYKEETGETITNFNEAPMLKDKVTSGELPPVEERLPEEPMVIKPLEQIGEYGGTWNRMFTGMSDQANMSRIIDEKALWWNENYEIGPNVLTGYEYSEDKKTITLHIRKGIRWSDGDLFTADDILFWWEDYILYSPESKEPNLSNVPAWLKLEGEIPEVEKVDDYTVKFNFLKPHALFPGNLVITGWPRPISLPKHYYEKFHPRYIDSVPEYGEKAREQFEEFDDKLQNPYLDTERPFLTPWVPVAWESGNYLIYERNPYYWKVDNEGNQLPYIDKVRFDIVENTETIIVKAAAGQIDMQARHIDFDNVPALESAAEKGNYKVIIWEQPLGADPVLFFNQNYKGPEGELLRNRDFRIALSHAIEREYINEKQFFGLATSMQATMPPGTPYYVEGLEDKFAEYDLEKANKMLDEIGLTEWVGDYRKAPWENEPLTFIADIQTKGWLSGYTPIMELIQEMWKEVGIKLILNSQERNYIEIRTENNEVQILPYRLDRTLSLPLEPQWIIPTYPLQSNIGPLWGKWFLTDGDEGEEPTGDMKRLFEMYEEVKLTVDEEKQKGILEEMLRIYVDNLWGIGTVGLNPSAGIVKNNMKNVPEKALQAWHLRTPKNTYTEQYFFIE